MALITDRPEAMGGTCVNFGCIPTKTLIQPARDWVESAMTAFYSRARFVGDKRLEYRKNKRSFLSDFALVRGGRMVHAQGFVRLYREFGF